MQTEQTLAPSTIIDDRLEIIERIGDGGMGQVYRARHLLLDKMVAVKVLRPELAADAQALKRFQSEAQLASALNHPNVAAVNNFGIFNSQPYIVLDFLEGQTLDDVLSDGATLRLPEFTNLFAQVCAGLCHAHGKGIVHRDIKPSNIFLLGDRTAGWQVKVLDFGIGKQLEMPEKHAQQLTKTGTVLGTPLYMSPEQAQGKKVDARSDIYSLGCVMYHACYGKPPFSGDSPYEILYNHTIAPVPLSMVPAGYPPGINVLLDKALAKNPAARYQSLDDLAFDLSRLSSLKSTPASPKLPASRALASKVNKALICALALLAALAAPYAVFRWLQRPHWLSNNCTIAQLAQEAKDCSIEALPQLMDKWQARLVLSRNPAAACAFLTAAERTFDTASRDKYTDYALFVLRSLPDDLWSSAAVAALPYELQVAYTRHGDSIEPALNSMQFAKRLSMEGKNLAASQVLGVAVRRSKNLTLFQDNTAFLFYMAKAMTQHRAFDSAYKLFGVLESQSPEQARCQEGFARIFDAQSRPDKAAQHWQQALRARVEPDSAQSVYQNQIALARSEAAAYVDSVNNQRFYNERKWTTATLEALEQADATAGQLLQFPALVAEGMLGSAQIEDELDQPELAEKIYARVAAFCAHSLPARRKAGDVAASGRLLLCQAAAAYQLGNPAQAMLCATSAGARQDLGYQPEQLRLLNYLDDRAGSEIELQQARFGAHPAPAALAKLSATLKHAHALEAAGDADLSRADYLAAAKHYVAAGDDRRDHDDFTAMVDYQEAAELCYFTGLQEEEASPARFDRLARAVSAFQRAVAIRTPDDTVRQRTRAYAQLGLAVASASVQDKAQAVLPAQFVNSFRTDPRLRYRSTWEARTIAAAHNLAARRAYMDLKDKPPAMRAPEGFSCVMQHIRHAGAFGLMREAGDLRCPEVLEAELIDLDCNALKGPTAVMAELEELLDIEHKVALKQH